MSLATECFSMYSDMSKRIRACSEPNRNSVSRLATSVLPTPVGPRNRKEPTGRFGLLSPARPRRMARARAEIPSSWLMMCRCSSSSMRSSLFISSSLIWATGTPVQRATTSSMSPRVTTAGWSRSMCQRVRKSSASFCRASCSSLSRAASS